jgi:hypothetical protein
MVDSGDGSKAKRRLAAYTGVTLLATIVAARFNGHTGGRDLIS